ncbi:MAG: SusD/RagB family nutrient-binding outer membrane lipoprotein [Mucilaginibacter sp.]|uniref:SusD/RagB family nutrient-binding outer membrane lipoprotein n=1 Tax=Mucilaginibacter sp. TaxID=1882438 RepID=UPI0031A35E97
MKNKKYFAMLALVLVSACKKGDVLYTSPNDPLNVTPAVLLTALEVNTIQNTEGDLARVSSILCEQMAGATGQYQALQNYNLQTSDYNNHWVGLYAGTMQNAKIMIDKYQATDPYYAGIAQVIMAINLGITTDLWGDVPYSQAFGGQKGVFVAPYDTQQQVIASIQSLLDQGIANFAKAQTANVEVPAGDDLYYGGDVAKWTKAAWTLKARYANRVSLKDPQSAANVLTYLAKGITSADDNLVNPHPAVSNAQNQWGAYQNQRAGNMVANSVFVDALKQNNDPRLPFYFSIDTHEKPEYSGADIKQEIVDADASVIGSYFDVASNYPLVTSYEASFLAAEAKIRLNAGDPTALADLNAGIVGSIVYVTKPDLSKVTVVPPTHYTAANLTNIMTEKWKAMFGQIEAYSDVRRTGIPAMVIRPASAGAISTTIPKRLPTPDIESQSNPDAKYIALDVPVWWGTK